MLTENISRGYLTTNVRYCLFAESGQCFSSRINESMPVSAETQLRLSSHEKTMPTYIVIFVGDTKQKNFHYRKKKLSASVWK